MTLNIYDTDALARLLVKATEVALRDTAPDCPDIDKHPIR